MSFPAVVTCFIMQLVFTDGEKGASSNITVSASSLSMCKSLSGGKVTEQLHVYQYNFILAYIAFLIKLFHEQASKHCIPCYSP